MTLREGLAHGRKMISLYRSTCPCQTSFVRGCSAERKPWNHEAHYVCKPDLFCFTLNKAQKHVIISTVALSKGQSSWGNLHVVTMLRTTLHHLHHCESISSQTGPCKWKGSSRWMQVSFHHSMPLIAHISTPILVLACG